MLRSLRALFFFACASVLLCASPSLRAETFEPEADLSTPRRAVATFLDAANQRDYERALLVLDVPPGSNAVRKKRATELAQKLQYVLSHSAGFGLNGLSDDPKGNEQDGADTETVADLRAGDRRIPIVLKQTRLPPPRWVFSAATLAQVPELYELRGPSQLERYMPPLLRVTMLGMERWQWLALPLALVLSVLVAQVLVVLLSRLSARLARNTRAHWDDELSSALRSPGRLLVTALAFVPLTQFLSLPSTPGLLVLRFAGSAGVAALGWGAIRVVQVVSNGLERRALRATESAQGVPQRSRAIRTKVRVLRRVLSVVIGALAGAVVLLQFETVRQVGVSILASAGVAGIVLGLAAQRTLGSLIAGIQLSFTEPIAIGDQVIVEDEFGTIEEITLTYVVVKVWDERRMIVPMTRFLEQPFQNWTKTSSDLHGTVLLYADFALPVAELRAALDQWLVDHPLWDGRTKTVQVTDANDRTLQVRLLVSAASAGTLFGLRCDIRERAIAWLVAKDGGRYLPRVRLNEPGPQLPRPDDDAHAESQRAKALRRQVG